MISIEAVRIVFAVLTGFRNDHRTWEFHFAGVSAGKSQASGHDQCDRRNCRNKFGFHGIALSWEPAAARLLPVGTIRVRGAPAFDGINGIEQVKGVNVL